MDRATTKKPIDLLANAVKDFVCDHDMMPGSRLCTIRNLFSERILRTASCRRRFLKHAHHYYDVIAAIYVWNHPEAIIMYHACTLMMWMNTTARIQSGRRP